MTTLNASSNAPPAPEHLSRHSQDLWRQITSDYLLEVHHVELLKLCLEAIDRGAQAREVLAEEGAYIFSGSGVRAVHPAVAVERDSRLAVARLLREIDLDSETVAPARPPRVRRSR